MEFSNFFRRGATQRETEIRNRLSQEFAELTNENAATIAHFDPNWHDDATSVLIFPSSMRHDDIAMHYLYNYQLRMLEKLGLMPDTTCSFGQEILFGGDVHNKSASQHTGTLFNFADDVGRVQISFARNSRGEPLPMQYRWTYDNDDELFLDDVTIMTFDRAIAEAERRTDYILTYRFAIEQRNYSEDQAEYFAENFGNFGVLYRSFHEIQKMETGTPYHEKLRRRREIGSYALQLAAPPTLGAMMGFTTASQPIIGAGIGAASGIAADLVIFANTVRQNRRDQMK